jgi:hypothetical protein
MAVVFNGMGLSPYPEQVESHSRVLVLDASIFQHLGLKITQVLDRHHILCDTAWAAPDKPAHAPTNQQI